MASQITATLPTLDFPREVDYPTQEDWAAFSAAAELNFGILGGDWSTQMQLWKTEANAMSTEFNTNATIAQGLADYQGDWTSQGYTLGQTVNIGEVYYICKLTHATGQNPTDVSSLYWNLALGNWNLKVDTNMSGYSSKTTPLDSDLLPLSDSSSSFGIKKLSWANLKATLATLFALKDSPVFTGTPTAPTQTAQDSSTKIATTAYVDSKMVLGTAVNSTSGTSIDFIGIPSWVKKITISFDGVSINGSSNILVQVGSSTVSTTGYYSQSNSFSGAGATSYGGVSSYNGHIIFDTVASYSLVGHILLTNIGNDKWVSSHVIGGSDNRFGGGVSPILSNPLDRVRITTVNGAYAFDAGIINIIYEG